MYIYILEQSTHLMALLKPRVFTSRAQQLLLPPVGHFVRFAAPAARKIPHGFCYILIYLLKFIVKLPPVAKLKCGWQAASEGEKEENKRRHGQGAQI